MRHLQNNGTCACCARRVCIYGCPQYDGPEPAPRKPFRWPTWIPRIGRPWNPAYGPVWDAMDDNAKRGSWLFDAAIVVIVISVLIWSK